MSDEELDTAIAERFKAYKAAVHLPGEFKGRFVSSIRRKRTVRRIWMFGLIGIMSLMCVAIMNFAKPAVASRDVKPALMVATARIIVIVVASIAVVVGMFFLGKCADKRNAETKSDTSSQHDKA